jgi:hypothetical protein
MVHVWLLHHSTHSVLDRSVGELVVRVLLPNVFQIKVWTAHLRLQELQVSCMCHRVRGVVEVSAAS